MADRKKDNRLTVDIVVALIPMCVTMALVMAFGQDGVLSLVADAPIFIRVLYTAFIQFSIAGLGAVVVMLIRKEGFHQFGLKKDGALKSCLYGLGLVALFIAYQWIKEGGIEYLPFRQVFLTADALGTPFPVNMFSMAAIVVAWGFFEGFNYVFFSRKINELVPIKSPFLRLGPIFMGIACILIHGAVGQDMLAILDSFLLVYLALLIPELTGNAWGVIVVFFLFWNAV